MKEPVPTRIEPEVHAHQHTNTQAHSVCVYPGRIQCRHQAVEAKPIELHQQLVTRAGVQASDEASRITRDAPTIRVILAANIRLHESGQNCRKNPTNFTVTRSRLITPWLAYKQMVHNDLVLCIRSQRDAAAPAHAWQVVLLSCKASEFGSKTRGNAKHSPCNHDNRN